MVMIEMRPELQVCKEERSRHATPISADTLPGQTKMTRLVKICLRAGQPWNQPARAQASSLAV